MAEIGLTWSDDLQCEWWCIRVLADGQIALAIAEGHCCDMHGAIRVATAVMPEVWRIKTVAGTVEDTEYWKVDGEWRAAYPSRLADASDLKGALNSFQRAIRAMRTEH